MSLLSRWKFHFLYNSRKPQAWDTGITPPELVEFVASHPPGRALDLGCGTGTNVIYLVQHGWQATGIDFAWSAIRYARRKAQQAGVKADLRVGDVTRLHGIDGPFDLILDIGCFHNLTDAGRPAYRSHIERLLDPSGTYLLYVHFKQQACNQRHGVGETELEQFTTRLRLVSRQDGFDRGHHSAWLAFTPAETAA